MADCDLKCDDGLSCGGQERYSLYEAGGHIMLPYKTFKTYNKTSYKSGGPMTTIGWIIVGCGIAGLLLGFVITCCCQQRKKNQNSSNYYTNDVYSASQNNNSIWQ
jgi:hypothetical protein